MTDIAAKKTDMKYHTPKSIKLNYVSPRLECKS
jgi:hypothetical protein